MSMAAKAKRRTCFPRLLAASLMGCTLLKANRQLITRDGATTFLVQDNTMVERMLALQRIQDAEIEQFWKAKHSKEEGIQRVTDMQANPTHYTPGRKEFLSSMSQQPGVFIPEKTYLRLIEGSGAHCNANPLFTTTYIKVRITSGPLRGREGWACEDSIARTVPMP